MAFQVSPGVNVTEFDLTTIIPASGGTYGAIAGEFNWGPVGIAQPVSTELKLVEKFGKPEGTGNVITDFFSAANFLQYSGNMLVSRAANTGTYNSVASIRNGAIANADIAITNPATGLHLNTANITVTFSAAPAGGVTATANIVPAALVAGNVNAINITNFGAGYTSAPTLTITEPGVATNATAVVTLSGRIATPRIIKNSNDYSNNSTVANGTFAARYAGTFGNNIKVSMWGNTTTALSTWEYGSYFDKAPATTDFISDNFTSTANDELYIVVVDTTGAISGAPNTVLEKFTASKATNARDENNNSMYYKDVLFNKSRWAYQVGYPAILGNAWGVAANSNYVFGQLATAPANTTYQLLGGTYATATRLDISTALNVFTDPALDVSLIVTSAHDDFVQSHAIQSIAEARKDCMVFVSPPLANVQSSDPVSSIVAYRTGLLDDQSSYAVMDSGWKYQYDKYNDTYRWIPLNADVAGMCARTDAEREPWFSPAGQVRGQVKSVVRLAYNPDQGDRDALYKQNINPVVSFNGEGTYLFGDKTLLGRQSAFNRINVRRLFIVLEKTISKAARGSLFEFNDEFTRSQFVSLVDPYLRSVQAGRGIYDYRIVCDDRNNTPEVIDRNEFVGDIYIKPARSVNFIQLNFVALRTGVAFEEIVGRF
jgi:hypothetical protein